MASSFCIEVVEEDEIPALAALIVRSFAHFDIETLVGNVDTPEAIQAAGERHLRSWREHKEETDVKCGVKCMAKDPNTGRDVMTACAYWMVFPKPRSPERMERPSYLISADWVDEENGSREEAKKQMQPVWDARKKWCSGRGHAILMYMATDKDWRRKGAATAVVQWGLDRCTELGIPAFLEASAEGAPVYQRLGFEVVDDVVVEADGVSTTFPVMMWWPPGIEEGEKKPLGS